MKSIKVIKRFMFGFNISLNEKQKKKMAGGSEEKAATSSASAPKKQYGTCPTWEEESFDEFILLYNNYTVLNEVEDDKKVRLLVNAMGSRGIKILKMLPADQKQWTVDLVVAAGRKLFCVTSWGTKPNAMVRA